MLIIFYFLKISHNQFFYIYLLLYLSSEYNSLYLSIFFSRQTLISIKKEF